MGAPNCRGPLVLELTLTTVRYATDSTRALIGRLACFYNCMETREISHLAAGADPSPITNPFSPLAQTSRQTARINIFEKTSALFFSGLYLYNTDFLKLYYFHSPTSLTLRGSYSTGSIRFNKLKINFGVRGTLIILILTIKNKLLHALKSISEYS